MQGCAGDSPGYCSGCRTCPAGQQVEGCVGNEPGECKPCPAGTFKSESGQDACKAVSLCATDEYDSAFATFNDTGREVDSACLPLRDCEVGYYDQDEDPLVLCSPSFGFFSSALRQADPC